MTDTDISKLRYGPDETETFLPYGGFPATDNTESMIVDEVRTAVSITDPESHVVTQHSLIKAAFPNSIPICTDAFMNVSKNHYPLPWLVREITQNFVDGNVENPGTLDGVNFQHVVDDSSDTVNHTFDISGDWPFVDPTGLVSLHSGKSSTPTKKNAGGNGIGLKQTVLRFMRDYGVKKFEITGEGWVVKYKMVSASEANQKLAEHSGERFAGYEIADDWLLATVEKSPNHGKCSYKIETHDTDVAEALSDFPNLGVSKNNKYLENPDRENEHGAFKWIPVSESEKTPKGRLFINGQVMNYKGRGKTAATYWDGPELVSIQLNNIDYDMSLDRPPVDPYNLGNYLNDLLKNLTFEELMEELKKSEYIWGRFEDVSGYSSDRMGCFALIKQIVEWLGFYYRSRDKKTDISSAFGPNYLYLDSKISDREKTSLREQGYILCPEYFSQLGLAAASTKIDAIDQIKKEKPVGADLRWDMEQRGLEVGHANIDFKKTEDFFPAFLKHFRQYIQSVEVVSEDKKSVKIVMLLEFPSEIFYNQMISAPSTPEAKKLHELRGFIAYALKHNIFGDIAVSNGKLATTFALTKDQTGLVSKVVKMELPSGIHTQVTDEAWVEFLRATNSAAFKKAVEKINTEAKLAEQQAKIVKKEQRSKARKEKIKEIRDTLSQPLTMPSFHFARVVRIATAALGVLGLIWVVKNHDAIAHYAHSIASSYSETSSGSAGVNETDEFNKWMNGEHAYGNSNTKRSGRRSLGDLLSDYDNSDVEPASNTETETQVVEAPRRNPIENFKIVETPDESQLKQLEVLREYVFLTTGVNVDNQLFIYTGKGAYGVNVGARGIGLHESLLDVGFDEALSTFAHEIAHNEYMNHGPGFLRMDSILKMAIHDSVYGIAVKEGEKKPLTEDEARIIRIETIWDRLRESR